MNESDIRRMKVTLFKIGKLYRFFDDRELFKELSEYCNKSYY